MTRAFCATNCPASSPDNLSSQLSSLPLLAGQLVAQAEAFSAPGFCQEVAPQGEEEAGANLAQRPQPQLGS